MQQIIADFVGDVLFGEVVDAKGNPIKLDTNFLVELKKNDRNLFQRFVEWVHSILKRLTTKGVVNKDIVKLEQKFKRLAEQARQQRAKGEQSETEQGEYSLPDVDKNNSKNYNNMRGDNYDSKNSQLLEGKRISTISRSKDGLRTYGANTQIIRRALGGLSQGKTNNDIPLAAGETAWLSSPNFRPAQKVGGGLEPSFLRNIQRVKSNGFDSIGRKLSPELQKKVSQTVFMEDDGTVFSFFHWTPYQFDEFLYGDGAFHCGTLKSALAIKDRSNKTDEGYIKEMYVISKNPFILRDAGRFGAYSVAPQLERFGIIDHKDLLRISKMEGFYSDKYDAKANVFVRGVLESLGYDSYLYQNVKEDGGAWSVGVFKSDQIITVAENGVLKENSGVTETDSIDGSVYSLPDLDTEYIKAVESGDTETAQRMVDEAAKAKGYTLRGYHGTNAEYSVINNNLEYGLPFFVTSDEKSAKTFGGHELSLYGRAEKPLVLDAEGKHIHSAEFKYRKKQVYITELLRLAKQDKYDCVVVKNTFDSLNGSGDLSEIYVFFYPEKQIKSADPVTYDDKGNVIPLSQRFNPENDDIRYSLPDLDSSGQKLSAGQMEYFKDSKAVDGKGNLLVLYHGTSDGGYTIFDPKYSDDERSIFLTDDTQTANSYIREQKYHDKMFMANQWKFIWILKIHSINGFK